MRKFEDWLNSIPLAGTIGAAFLSGAIYGREFDISWETLAAGFFGLVGGGFAYVSAKLQIKANEELRQSEAEQKIRKKKADFYIEACFATDLAITNIDRIQIWFEGDNYPGDDGCKICIEILRSIEIPRPPYTVNAETIHYAQQIKRTRGLLITSIENSIAALDDHADRNDVILGMLRDLKKANESLYNLASEGLIGMNDQA